MVPLFILKFRYHENVDIQTYNFRVLGETYSTDQIPS
jgi:hypothetical protein